MVPMGSVMQVIRRASPQKSPSSGRSSGPIIEPGFGGVEPPMEDIPDGQLMWMSHLIPHFLNDPRRSYRLAEAASDMITRLLARPLLPQNTLANCLLATCLLMGSRVGPNELVKLDKSPAVETLLDLALEGLRDRLSKDVIRQRLNLDPTDPTVNALKLLYPLAFLVDVEKFRVIFDNRGIPVWAMQFSKTLVQKALHGATLHPVARFMLCRDARNALRLRLNIITRRIHPYPTSEGFIEWMTWDDPKEDEADFHWLVDFLIYQCKENDYVAIGDALLTLSNIRGLDKCARITGYIGAIIAASGSGMPLRVRHAALKAACAIRNELANPQGEATRARLLDDFSSALWRAALLTIDPPGYRQAPLSPDRFLYYHRDLCYVQIVFALAQNDIWETHLCNDGHFERCLAVAKELRDDNTLSQQHKGHLSLYVLALFVNPQTGELDLLANVVGRDYCDSLIVMAWAFLYAADRRRDDSHQAIRPLITCTMWRWRQRESIHGTPWKAVAVHAEHVLRVLRQENATPSLVHLVENLVVLIRNS
ncbi:hypothetical protein BV22DRAFT_40454 [Leucogyrophana mollusca]|uniref:Uncharacterized protein n=1 Tax=Leucogyrophana mollusca TaxID=85980 RepID=A0ACB8C1D6_9AGAM|nr:hypothetical protein BV22DRAFT_40454 [Leucogyrophana mollusca]